MNAQRNHLYKYDCLTVIEFDPCCNISQHLRERNRQAITLLSSRIHIWMEELNVKKSLHDSVELDLSSKPWYLREAYHRNELIF